MPFWISYPYLYHGEDTHMIFDPITINNVTFANRLLRSSVGGRSAYYNGAASDV
jgi:2,4-dienoyl-CoA reductase-like NADH-dependent reductase (Old Yellow Enzyme family)